MSQNENTLRINSRLFILLDEIDFSAVRSSGPGGQHVNTTNSAIQLKWDSRASKIPSWAKARIAKYSDQRIGADGVITLKAQNQRSQHRNRVDALDRLAELIRQAVYKPKPRIKTRPSRAAKERRITRKKQRGDIKKTRGKVEW